MAIGKCQAEPLGMLMARRYYPPPVVKSAVGHVAKSRPNHAVDRQKLHLVLQPPREEGRVLLLEEERRPRFTRFDDAVLERRQPRL